jgi:hypothetical protein
MLQINLVIEDEKIGLDDLQEEIAVSYEISSEQEGLLISVIFFAR